MKSAMRIIGLVISLFISAICTAQEDCNCKPADTLRQKIGKYYNSGKLDSAILVLNELKASTNNACQIVYLDGIGQIAVAKKKVNP